MDQQVKYRTAKIQRYSFYFKFDNYNIYTSEAM
jgi:hypothetical protein